jgi:hypothetical protein
MKNQYVGDINDFRKYGLIHSISKVFGGKILFVWMLSEEDNNDGNKIGYLNKDKIYRKYNQDIFDELKIIVENKKRNNNIDNIIAVENSKLFKQYEFFNDFIKDDKKSRTEYFEKVYKLIEKFDIIFLDPDNGIEVPSCKSGNKKSSKYIYWEEIEKIFNCNKNILIYQHFPYKKHETFTKDIVNQCRSKLNGAEIVPIITKDTLFIYIVKNSKDIISKLEKELSIWAGEMKIGK